MRVAVKNLPKSTTRGELEETFNRGGNMTDIYMLENSRGHFRRVCFIGYKTEEEAVSVQRYFHNAMFKNHRITVELAKEETCERLQKSESQERRILYSKTIFIRGLSTDIDTGLLKEELEKVGRVLDIRLERKKNGGCALAKFREGAHAVSAFKKIRILLGMRVKIGPYNETHLEKKREYYNSLFFNFDTVIKRTCEMERIDKRDLVDIRDTGLGSKVALLETNLVAQTRDFLEHNNIYLGSIKEERSKNILILRNADLLGALDLVRGDYKVSLAPSKCLALLEFHDEKEAADALKSLNLRRYKSQIIYCEFAPICRVPEGRAEEPVPSGAGGPKLTNKIVVKNVPFQASVSDLKNIFASYTHVVDVRLPIKSDKTHRGFGFIILDSSQSVDRTIEYFGASTHLYGRRLVLERAKS